MSDHIALTQTTYSEAVYDNGILYITKRTGGTIKHKNVPQSIFLGFQTSGNHDSYYKERIANVYPLA
nr:MAG TPA: KTSC domain [Caudoviricetes sp.]